MFDRFLMRIIPSVEFVLLRLNIVLKEDLDLVVHLWPYVLQEKCRDDSHHAESN